MSGDKRVPLDTTSSMPDQQQGVVRLEETAADVMVKAAPIIHQAEWSQTIRIPIAELARLRHVEKCYDAGLAAARTLLPGTDSIGSMSVVIGAELRRLRSDAERWRWVFANPLAYWSITQSCGKWETVQAVDNYIAVEKGAGE